MTKLEHYQDYVIKDGRLVGQFEDKYQNYTDPWEQTTRGKNALEKFIGLQLLSKYGHKYPIEYGCGLGEYTQKMFENYVKDIHIFLRNHWMNWKRYFVRF